MEDVIIHQEKDVSPKSSGGYDTASPESGLNPDAEEFVPTPEEVDPEGTESELSQSDSDEGHVSEGSAVDASSTESYINSEQVRRSSQV